MTRILLIALAALIFLAPGSAQTSPTGYAVISIGDLPDLAAWQTQYGGYTLKYRQIGGTNVGEIVYHRFSAGGSVMRMLVSAVSTPAPDYTTPGKDMDGRGMVEVRKLPAGDYEIYSVDIKASVPLVDIKWWPQKDVSIKFHVPADGAVYIGNFTAHHVARKNFVGYEVPNGATFAVSDEAVRDEPIARKKVPGLPAMTKQPLDLSDPVTAIIFHPAESK